MRLLFPKIEPYASGFIKVDDLHELYFEQSGNPEGYPVVFLHGGPGAGASIESRRFFDPTFYRIIVFDQRGAGRSKPHGEMRQNTTQFLVDDTEQLRKMLQINEWMIFGGSWGTTLALSYAEAYPERCSALVLRGIFLCRPSEIDWFYNGTKHVYPEVWDQFVDPIPICERGDLLNAYHRRVMDPNPLVHETFARIYNRYETQLSRHSPSERDAKESFDDLKGSLSLARAETHYFKNHIFQKPNQILDEIHRIRHIPTHVIHGRYDMVCPIKSAFDLLRAWPEIEAFKIIPDGGHSAFDPPITHALIESTECFKNRL